MGFFSNDLYNILNQSIQWKTQFYRFLATLNWFQSYQALVQVAPLPMSVDRALSFSLQGKIVPPKRNSSLTLQGLVLHLCDIYLKLLIP